MYKRFKWNPEIRFTPGAMPDMMNMPDGSKVFWGSTFELFHDSVPNSWREIIFYNAKIFDNLTHIFLTKQPQNLIKLSPFPDNCWVGVTITDPYPDNTPLAYLAKVEAKVKYISFEPLLKWGTDLSSVLKLSFEKAGISWVILGSQTQPTRHPSREWVDEIITAADKAGIPVFVKEPMASHFNIHRQEFPVIASTKGEEG